MYPSPWANSVPPPTAAKPSANNYENSAQSSHPFYAAQNLMQNMAQVNQQNNLTLNTPSMANKSLQPNAIDPAMVQKWQEWKQWELWQQQFQQWQQQTGQIPAATTQPAPPPMPPSQLSQPQAMAFQTQQFAYNPQGPPLPQSNPPLPNQHNVTKNDTGLKRGLESDTQNNEKKLKTDTANSKKEIELNDETEALFEEQFKSWEEQFFKWKEQNKNHPDKTQYLEYEKKWLNWRDHLKQKCETLKKKRELKMAEKKKEAELAEEIKLQSQQRLGYNPMMMPNPFNALTNEPLPRLHNNNSSLMSTTENQIPGLDLVSTNENASKGFLNVARILPQNLKGPMQTPDDKPFNFPKNITNSLGINPHLNTPLSSMNQPPTSMYQNSPTWSNNKYNNPVLYNNQKPPDVDKTSLPPFSQQTDVDSRLPYSGNTSNSIYNNSLNVPSMNYRRPLDGSYNKPPCENNAMYSKSSDDQSYNRNMNTPSDNFFDYNKHDTNTSTFNKFNQVPEKTNIPYHQSKPLMNMTSTKPPSLLSLNLVKPTGLDKPGNYMENKNVTPNRYEQNWNTSDDYDDPENEYMEAHKKFSSEPFDDQNDDNRFSNNKYNRGGYNENQYSRGQSSSRNNFSDNYSRPLNHSRGSQMMRNTDNEFLRPNSQFSRNVDQNYSQETLTSRNHDEGYYKSQNNMKLDQSFLRGRAPLSNDIDEEYSDEPAIGTNFKPQQGNYGPSSRGNYRVSSRGNYDSPIDNFGNTKNKTNQEWDKDYVQNERPLLPVVKDITAPLPIIKPPYESAPPVDPVKIFDYRHLPTLKVIPGLIKETVVPIRIYDHKHGGKRILPWQDRGYSRRNSNTTRNLSETEGSSQNNLDDLDKNKESLIEKPSIICIDISSEETYSNSNEDKIDKIKEVIPITTEIITIEDDEKKKEEGPEKEVKILSPVNETIDMCAPSPPRVSKIIEAEKLPPRKLLTIETLLCPPGRFNRPSKIVIILRGLPGSGKSHVARLIKDKEVAMGGQAPRILSLDDYFMTEVTKTEIDPETNKKVEFKEMEYEHDSANENLYRTSFIKAFKKKILENFFSFFIIDAINNKVTYYKDIVEISRVNGFTVYVIELESDVDLCIKRNIHNRTANDINNIMKSWVKTPPDQILLDIQSLLDSSLQNEIDMEDVSDVEMELDNNEETVDVNKPEEDNNAEMEEEDVMKLLSCKWTDTIPQEEKMKRLDGLCKKKAESSIKEWLQIPEDNYTVSEQVVVKDGKKRVRWADMEERREQEKMRAIGFVVGQTNWDRMLGRDQGESKLTQTKYI